MTRSAGCRCRRHPPNVFDSPDLAIRDFLTHGVDANPDWVRLYARDSKREVYDWLNALGVGSRLCRATAQRKVGFCQACKFDQESLVGTSMTLPATPTSDPESLRAWRDVLLQLVAKPRPGYLHFEKAHSVVLEQKLDCAQCHREPSPSPLALNADQLDRHALIRTCAICHGSVKE